jgi:hypothetical protein
MQCGCFATVPVGLGISATIAVIVESGNAVLCRHCSRHISSLLIFLAQLLSTFYHVRRSDFYQIHAFHSGLL